MNINIYISSCDGDVRMFPHHVAGERIPARKDMGLGCYIYTRTHTHTHTHTHIYIYIYMNE